MSTAPTSTRLWRVLITPKKDQSGIWVAHCLETGYVTSAYSFDRARDMMLNVLREEYLFARKHNNMNSLFRPIPQELLDQWEEVTNELGVEQVSLFPEGAQEVEVARAA